VACIEREDFASGTSSRSTKLIWGGSRYLVQAFVNLLSKKLFTAPGETIRRFQEDFKMVMNCHRERKFMLRQQPHLTKWLPIAVPFDRWFLVPPPFGFLPAIFGPFGLFPAFFKFYDALSGFTCPPSHIMNRKRALRKFPQLAYDDIKYCSIFYEGTHDDARTNLAIAQTAAVAGAHIANYCDAKALIHENESGEDLSKKGRVVGARVRDVVSGKEFSIRAKSILLCGGPFTDELRAMEDPNSKPAIDGASGIHIVLPAYFAPDAIGFVDMNTSDGRFMFFLPWKDHVIVGTTDHHAKPTMRPVPDESVSPAQSKRVIPLTSQKLLTGAGDQVAAARSLEVHQPRAEAAPQRRAQRVVRHPTAGQGPTRLQHRLRQQGPRHIA
jgi:glycerol-3-phosphate dehydrogenase